MNLSQLFSPESIAVVGASRSEGKIGYEAMANIKQFEGPIYPVNPSESGSVFSEPFRASVTDVDKAIDLALLCVPAPVVPNVLDECGAAGIGGVVIYAGGFAEAGEEGKKLQNDVTEIAAEHDIALLGPNTSGFVDPSRQLYASFAGGVEQLQNGDVAILAQSGGVAHQLAFHALREERGISAMVGLGNRANVGFDDAIPYFDDDPNTRAIVVHIEGTEEGRALLETCRNAETPVAAYKVGQSDVKEFAESHTGALTGDHTLYSAGFSQYGVPAVESTDALFDLGVALANSPRPDGSNVGVVTAQAGPGIIIADIIQQRGGRLPSLSEATQKRVDDILSNITYSGNPVDTGRPMPEFGEVVEAVTEDENIDIVLIYELFEEAIGFPTETLNGLAQRVGKPVLFVTEGPPVDMADDIAALREVGIPVFTSPERGAETAGLLASYANTAIAPTEVNADA